MQPRHISRGLLVMFCGRRFLEDQRTNDTSQMFKLFNHTMHRRRQQVEYISAAEEMARVREDNSRLEQTILHRFNDRDHVRETAPTVAIQLG